MRQKSATTRELFAIFTFCRQFEHFFLPLLLLLYKKFVVRTDHKPLTWLETINDVDRMAARWHEELQQYDFEIQHSAGKAHGNADALSDCVTCVNAVPV